MNLLVQVLVRTGLVVVLGSLLAMTIGVPARLVGKCGANSVSTTNGIDCLTCSTGEACETAESSDVDGKKYTYCRCVGGTEANCCHLIARKVGNNWEADARGVCLLDLVCDQAEPCFVNANGQLKCGQ